jgi:multiple sugar transport system permease protein
MSLAARPAIGWPRHARLSVRLAGSFAAAAKLTLAAIFVVPLVWMFLSSFRPAAEIFQYIFPLSIRTFAPVHPTLDSYRRVFQDEPFGRYLWNSFAMAGGVAVLDLVVSSLAAYGFARVPFSGKGILFFLVLAVMIIPFEGILVPLYLIVRSLGWVNSFAGLIIPMVPRAFSIFLLRQFFLGLPVELEDAARIDGCGHWGIYWHIMLPLSRPILLSVGLLSFQEMWGSFTWPLVVTNTANMQVIQVAVATFGQGDAIQWDKIFAGLSLAAALPILLFIMFQRFYVRGIATTGLKG